MKNYPIKGIAFLSLLVISCNEQPTTLVAASTLELKKGEIISCGPVDGEVFGTVSFSASVPPPLQTDFNMAVALLHSFEYDEAEKVFAKIIDKAPDCAMAYWGVAMSNFHSLWAPPTPAELQTGVQSVAIARSIKNKTKRESDYIEAIGTFYDPADGTDHRSRVVRFEKAMEKLYQSYPEDFEAAVFYALALNAAAEPTDKTYANQKKAVAILEPVFRKQPLHPGIAHYIIHNYDYPGLAMLALPAARKHASIAPASAHAQHMPSHIFTRLGLWEECIKSNLVSAASAKCYGEKAGLKGHWDEELHAMDYLVYAYLQRGKDDLAERQVEYLKTITTVQPLNFKTAYAFAAIPGRYMLERKQWKDAAAYLLHPKAYPWEKFPWQKSIYHFTKMMGAVHTDQMALAEKELDAIKTLHEALLKEKEKGKEAAQVVVQVKMGAAWLQFRQGHSDSALMLMRMAADMEDRTEKHPVTPGEVIPAREMLGELLLEMKQPALALEAFELTLVTHPNRFNALYGAGLSAMNAGNPEKAKNYFNQLIIVADPKSTRTEVQQAWKYLRTL